VIEDQKIVVGEPPLQNVQGNNEQNQQANLLLFNIKMMTTRMTCESLKRGRREVKSRFPFSFFKSLLFIFEFFYQIQR
jgi:hypothetical protein